MVPYVTIPVDSNITLVEEGGDNTAGGPVSSLVGTQEVPLINPDSGNAREHNNGDSQ